MKKGLVDAYCRHLCQKLDRGDRKVIKILIINSTYEHFRGWEHNLGNVAVMPLTIQTIRELMPNVELSTFIQLGETTSEQWGVRVVRRKAFSLKPFSLWQSIKSSSDLFQISLWAALHKYFNLNIEPLISSRKLKEFSEADIILHLGLNDYSSDFGTWGVIEHSKDILLGVLLGKPVVMYAESIGPFRTRLTSWLAKFTLNRVALITLREEISGAYLQKLGVNEPPIHLTADPAFLLKPTSKNRVEEILLAEGIDSHRKPLVGITISSGVNLEEAKKGSKYLALIVSVYSLVRCILPEKMIKIIWGIVKQTRYYTLFESSHVAQVDSINDLIDFLIDKLKANIIFIPHMQQKGTLFDDPQISWEICQSAKCPDRAKPITGFYSPEELKGIIGQCDLYITVRMHASIAAMSQYVPTVLVLKNEEHRRGVIKMLGQEKYVCNSLTLEELVPKIDEAWASRGKIRRELASKIPKIKEAALLNTTLVKELLDSWNRA